MAMRLFSSSEFFFLFFFFKTWLQVICGIMSESEFKWLSFPVVILEVGSADFY